MTISTRVRLLVLAVCAALAFSACSATNGSDDSSSTPTTPTSSGPSTPDFNTSSPSRAPTTVDTSSTAPTSASPSAPAKPVRTVTATAPDGSSYVVTVWVQRRNTTCADHAYGQVQAFLRKHPCRGMQRLLATTTVDGRKVGMSIVETGFLGTAQDPYAYVGQFRTLVNQNGTGSINDLLREGYRLPSGPTSVPSPDAFAELGQDNVADIYDMWYLDGSTPENAKPLETLAQDIFLQV